MSSQWTIPAIARALGCEPVHINNNLSYKGVSIDSRTTRPENIFICIRGDRTDGHLYISKAIEAGATALIVEEASLASGILELPRPGNITIFSVTDTIAALQDLAGYYRNCLLDIFIIGVSGSNGKTSCKEMLAGFLDSLIQGGQWFATKGNLNNHIGVPLSLLDIAKDTRFAVLEMGMNHPGEIELLSKLIRPDIALITSVAGAHMEYFNSIEDIAHAKLEIISGLKKSAWLFWPQGTPVQNHVEQVCKTNELRLHLFDGPDQMERKNKVQINFDGISFQYNHARLKNPHYFSQVMASNMIVCMMVLEKSGFRSEKIMQSVSSIRPLSSGRFEVIRIKRDGSRRPQLLVDDSYNANPESFVQALRSLRLLIPEGRLAVLAGQMAELGDACDSGHEQTGRMAADCGYDFLAICGDETTEIMIKGFENNKTGHAKRYSHVNALVADLDKMNMVQYDGILVKGSRASNMEIAARKIKEMNYV